MRRRAFLALTAAACVALPSRGQSRTPPRVIGMMIVNAEGDPEGRARASALRRALQDFGWVDGGNIRIHVRWEVDNPQRAKAHAEDLLGLRPDVIVANGTPAVAALRQATSTVPIVFVVVTDPLGAGYVRSLARPGGNVTGFSTFEPEIGGKWLELLKEIAPDSRRVACIYDPGFTGFASVWREIESAGPRFGLSVSSIVFRESSDDLESAITSFAKEPGGGMIVSPTAINNAARERIIALAAHHRLPAVYPFQHFAAAGGLLAYGFDPHDLFVRSAAYVDRILKGDNPGDLPVQAPTKYEMVVNLRTAKALGLSVSPQFLARADRTIE